MFCALYYRENTSVKTVEYEKKILREKNIEKFIKKLLLLKLH